MAKAKTKHLSDGQAKEFITKLKQDRFSELSPDERQNIVNIVETWAHLRERARNSDLKLSFVLSLFGIKPSSKRKGPNEDEDKSKQKASVDSEADTSTQTQDEKNAVQTEQPKATSDSDEKSQGSKPTNRNPHGRRNGKDFPQALVHHHPHTELTVGDRCPDCGRGRLYEYEASAFTFISSQAPFVATRHVLDQLQCGLCQAIFRAKLSPDVVADGGDQKNRPLYAHSAVAMIVIFKFFGVMPWKRLETIQEAVGVYVPDSSMSDQSERLANAILPVVRLLWHRAGNAHLFYGDDTGALILGKRTCVKPDRRTGEPTERCGCHTTCVIAVTQDNQTIVLFRIGIQHTGELMDQILINRADDMPDPLFMSDASSANEVTVCKVIECRCNSHAVRKFKEIVKDYPKEAEYALERFSAIYDNEELCKKSQMDQKQRLAYHRQHSKSLHKEICLYGHELIESKAFEPKSPIYKAYDYVLNHEYGLSAFYRHLGAPLDNNISEQILRLPVRLRDGAPFFRTEVGARVADTILTLGVTAINAKVNLFDYFVALLRHQDDVKAHPANWLPWTYRDRQRELEEFTPKTQRNA